MLKILSDFEKLSVDPLFLALVFYISIYIYVFMVSLPATWETRGERRLKEGPGFLEEQLHGARGEAGDWSHGGGWSS